MVIQMACFHEGGFALTSSFHRTVAGAKKAAETHASVKRDPIDPARWCKTSEGTWQVATSGHTYIVSPIIIND